jgi:hypothetical protein
MPKYIFSCPKCGSEEEIEFDTEREAREASGDAWCEQCDKSMKIIDSYSD